MDVERIIDEIEQLQEMFEAPDIRPLSAGDISAANRRHDEMIAHSPWFRLWHKLWRLLSFLMRLTAYPVYAISSGRDHDQHCWIECSLAVKPNDKSKSSHSQGQNHTDEIFHSLPSSGCSSHHLANR